MAVRLLPDAELLAIEYLRAHPDVDALVDGRVYGELPHEPTFPVLTLFRLPGRVIVPRHFVAARLQIDAWAETKGAARTVAETARAALYGASEATHTEGVVTGLEEILDIRWEPDPENGLPRYLFEIELYVHPLPD